MIKSMFYEDDRFEYYETDETNTVAWKTKKDTDWTFYYHTLDRTLEGATNDNDFDKKLKSELEKYRARNKFRQQLSIVLADNE